MQVGDEYAYHKRQPSFAGAVMMLGGCFVIAAIAFACMFADLDTRLKAVEAKVAAPTQVLPEPCPE